MAPGRKHASFRLRSQSDNGVIIELTPLSVCGCISLRLTPSGAALTSFLMPASAVHQLGCKGGARGSSCPSAHASCSPDVCACGIFMVRLVSVAFLIWGVKLAFLHCVVLMGGNGAQRDSRPCLLEEPEFVSFVLLILSNGGRGLEISHFLSRKL